MRRAQLPLLSIVALLLPGVAGAQKVPAGPQFQVNTYTTGDQGYTPGCAYTQTGRGHAVASDASGNFVVVWTDSANLTLPAGDGQDGSLRGIFAQRHASDGSRIGGEFRVNSYTTGNQSYPRIAMESTGEFVVVWSSQYSYDYVAEIRGQRYDSGGSPAGGEFVVTSDAGYYEYNRYPAIAMNDSGQFVVVWESGDGCCGGYIYGRRFASDGSPQGGEFQANTSAHPGGAYDQSPDVIMEPGGEFVVAWQAGGSDYYCSATYSILGRRYDSAGASIGGEFAAGSTVGCEKGYFELSPRLVRTGGGSFVVVWSSSAYDADPAGEYGDIAAHRFDSAGSSVGGVFRVNTYTTGSQRCPAVAGAGDGSFVVTWRRDWYSRMGVGQQFDSNGTPLGGEFLINTNTLQNNVADRTSVAAAANGDFVVTWIDDDGDPQGLDGDGFGIFGQRFDDVGAFTCTPAPRTNCRTQTKDRGAFRFRENATNPAGSSMAWRWPRGESTSKAEFGDMFTDVNYAFCVYDRSPNPQPLLSAVLPPGGMCGPAAIPCWRELTGFGPPLFYLDGNRTQGGIVQLRLKPGATDNTRITTRARGENLTLPATPLTAPVVVQLQGSHGECFTARYEERIRKNEGGVFRARPGSPSAAFLDAGAAVLD